MTTLTKYNPLDSVDTLFNRVTRDLLPTFDRFLKPVDGELNMYRLPLTNINENETSFVLTVEMPGLTRKDVELAVDGDVLTIEGRRSASVDEKGLLHNEIRSHEFRRQFNLPTGIDREKVTANMKNGLLTITMAKAPDRVGRKIEIE